MEYYTACFFGHRKIDETEELKNNLYEIIEDLIVNENVDTFFFGNKSEFDDLCHKTVTELKEKHSYIKRIYVRSAFQHIPDWYEDSLLKHYEGTYFPEHMENAGRASYVERNQEMINRSFVWFTMMKTICHQDEETADGIYSIINLKAEPLLPIITQ